MVVSECNPSKYCDKNQREIYFLSSYLLYYMHLKKIFGCYTLVTTRLLIFEWFLKTHPCDCWGFWSAKYNLCNHGKPSKKSIWFIWFAWQSHCLCKKQRVKFEHINQCFEICSFLLLPSITCPICTRSCFCYAILKAT